MFVSVPAAARASPRFLTVAAGLLAALTSLPGPTPAFASGVATVTPAAHYFGVVQVGATASQDFTFSPDPAGSAVSVASVTIAEANADQFQLVGSCPGIYTGGADGSCVVTVQFTPTVTTPATAELRFVFQDASNPLAPPQVAAAVLTGGPIAAASPTTLTYTGATAAEFGDPVALSATLAGPSGPLAGRTIVFTLDGRTVSAVTDATGTATATLPSGSSAGMVLVTFAGTPEFSASTATAAFSGRPDATTLVIISPVAATAGAAEVQIAAQLTDDAGAPVAGRSVLFTACPARAGDGDKDEKETHNAKAGAVCVGASALTNAAGVATVHFALGPGRYLVTAAFAGNVDHLASVAHAPLTVNRGHAKNGDDSKDESSAAGD